MHFDPGRKKNLTLAFHFYLSGADRWLCQPCRSAGLEEKRRCGWLNTEFNSAGQPVWTRRDIHTTCCPKPLIHPETLSWLEGYAVLKKLGGALAFSSPAKTVDAYVLLEDLTLKERVHQLAEKS
jgi:hypothetical protein